MQQSGKLTAKPFLKVLAVVTNFGRHGAGVTLARFLENSDRARLDIHLCTIDGPGPEVERFKKLGFPVTTLHRSGTMDLGIVWKLQDMIKRGGFDLVYGPKHSSFFLARPAARLAGTRFLGHERGWPLQFVSKRVLTADRVLSRGTHLIVANSNHTASVLQKVIRVEPARIRRIYNPIPLRPKSPAAAVRTGDAPIVGCFARLSPEKGVDVLVRSMPRILRTLPKTQLRIFGEGSLEQPLRELVDTLGLSSSVKLLPWQADIFESMGEVDIVAIPSLVESFGNVAAEAALAGKPVVAAEVGGLPEILDVVKHGVTVQPTRSIENPDDGWVPFAAGEPILRGKGLKTVSTESLAKAIVDLWLDPDRRRALVEHSHERVSETFSLESYTRKLTRVMIEAASIS